MLTFGDALIAAFNCFGFLVVAGLLAMLVAAAYQVIQHRKMHKRLGLVPGSNSPNECPTCMKDAEITWLPVAVWSTRDRQRKRRKREEFDA